MILYGSSQCTDRKQAYDLLSHGALQVWQFSPLPEISRAELGKPYFSRYPHHHFNLSHSGPFALCALDDSPVGVDIQIIKDSWRDALPRRVCSEGELAWLEEQPERWAAFAQLWALKECRVKYSGEGLRRDVRSISIPLPRAGETLHLWEGLWFRTYSGEGWQAAVCGESPPPENILWIERKRLSM